MNDAPTVQDCERAVELIVTTIRERVHALYPNANDEAKAAMQVLVAERVVERIRGRG
ncbi:MAG TPA: hypothetical protein VEJ18_06340 [Planctomycetota bacterium]|nr:hypothetical protein [Planctomycetota bacterium]